MTDRFNNTVKLTRPPQKALGVTYRIVDTAPPKVMHLPVNELKTCDGEEENSLLQAVFALR